MSSDRGGSGAGGMHLPALDDSTKFGADSREASLWSDAWVQCKRRPLFWVCITIIGILVVAAVFPGLFTGKDPRACSLRDSLLRPSGEHWFGTDLQGCDYYARIVYGARVSISIGVLVTGVAAIIAVRCPPAE